MATVVAATRRGYSRPVSSRQLSECHEWMILTCLRDCDEFAIVAVACPLEVLRELSRLATSCLADDDGDWVGLDGVQEGIFVAGYRQQGAGSV